jgi:uncharacterized protein with NRDE domain
MCTVVYLPLKKSCFLASLRDELAYRSASPPTFFNENTTRIIKPTDSKGGTWIGANSLGFVIVLLNGGFVKHTVQANYRKSRGLIMNEMLASNSPVELWTEMDLAQIEPFSTIVYSDSLLVRLVWDGEIKHTQKLDSKQAHIFSSATLYNEEAALRRAVLFKEWLKSKTIKDENSLLRFFKSVDDKENGFFIQRQNGIETISFSFISVAKKTIRFSYTNFLDGKSNKQILQVENS